MTGLRGFLGHPAFLWTASVTSGVIILAAGVWVGLGFIPDKAPDVANAGLDDVSAFVMDEDFNRLPPKERLDYMLDLMERFKNMDQDDLAYMAETMSALSKSMRDQIEENMRKLAVDLMSDSAAEYSKLSPEDRAAYLDNLMLDLLKIGERFDDTPDNKSDSEKLADAKAQAKRDEERAQEGSRPLTAERVGGFMSFVERSSSESGMGAVQKGQVAVLFRDMTRHFRGQDVSKGP